MLLAVALFRLKAPYNSYRPFILVFFVAFNKLFPKSLLFLTFPQKYVIYFYTATAFLL